MFFIMGFDGETRHDLELSRNFILDTMPDDFEINIFTPYPGTPLWEKKKDVYRKEVEGKWYRLFRQEGIDVKVDYDLTREYRRFLYFSQNYKEIKRLGSPKKSA